jgi:hypothetical protein
MAQNVVYPGDDWVFAYHQDDQDLTGLYGPILAEDGTTIVKPTADVVPTPKDFVYAYDEYRRRLDPRRFAGDGGTPLDPVSAAQVTRTGPVLSTLPAAPPRAPVLPPAPPSSPVAASVDAPEPPA